MIKRLLKDFAVYGIGDVLLKAISIFTFPIYTRLFTVEEYGVLNTIATIIGLIMAFLALGADSAYARYYFDAENDEDKQVITSTALFALLVWSILSTVILLPLSGALSVWTFKTPQYAALFFLSLAAIPLTLANSICAQVLRNQFRAGLFSILNAATVILTVLITLILTLELRWGLRGILIGTLTATAVMLPIRLWYIRDVIRLKFSATLLWKMLGYGLPLVPTSLAYWVFASSDRIVLSQLSTLEQVGLYSVANQVCLIGAFLYNALGQAWSPHAVQMYNEDAEQASITFGKVMNYILLGFGFFCVGISAFARETLLVLATPQFVGAAAAVAPLALGFVAYASAQVTGIGISLKKKTFYFAIFAWLAAILNLLLNIWFVPRGGMLASAWATTAAYFFLTIAYFIVAQKLFFIRYQIGAVLSAALLMLAFTIGTYWIPQTENLLLAFGLKTLYVIFYGVCSILTLAFFSPQFLRDLAVGKFRKNLTPKFLQQ